MQQQTPGSVEVIDLSHPICPEMPLWPGTPAPEFLPLATVNDDGFAEQSIHLSSHTGTHLDAPAHLIDGAATIDRFVPGQFMGRVAVIDACAVTDGVIRQRLLEPYGTAIGAADFVLLHTGWARFWGQAAYGSGYPVLDDEAAEWLAGMGLKGVGIDAPSFDTFDSQGFPVHLRLLRRGVLLVENLANLHLLPPSGCTLAVFPLPVRGAEACPVRAVAILWP
ncbi:MAG: cyclase family protein [Chlorobiaceae bacterium]|nr:cyclase family protein [Chlorobiaceae bacterium]